MTDDKKYTCSHCGMPLMPWRSPDITSWGGRIQYVCFNDECSYYKNGWEWMLSQYNVKASYRHRLDPETGETGPLPVWSPNALRERLDEGPDAPEDAPEDVPEDISEDAAPTAETNTKSQEDLA